MLQILAGSLACLILATCGATKSDVAVTVAGTSISRGEVAHWEAIKRREAAAAATTRRSARASPREEALDLLINTAWLQRESERRGVNIPKRSLNEDYARLASGKAGAAFLASVRRSGLGKADEIFLLRAEVLAARELESLKVTSRRSAAPLLSAFRARWRAQTHCNLGYVVSDCANAPPAAK